MTNEPVTKKPDTREEAKKKIQERLTKVASQVISEAASIMVEGLAGQRESLDSTNRAVEGISSRLTTVEGKQKTVADALEAKQKATDSVVTTNSERISKVESRQEEVSRLKVQAQAASAKADQAISTAEQVKAQLDQKPDDELVSRVGDLETAHGALSTKVEELSSKDATPVKGVGLDSFQEMAQEIFGNMLNDVKAELNKVKRVVAELKAQIDAKPQSTAPAESEPAKKTEQVKEKPKLSVVAPTEQVPKPEEAVSADQDVEVDAAVEVLEEVELVADTLRDSAKELKQKISKLAKELGEEIDFEPVETLDEDMEDAEGALKVLADVSGIVLDFEPVHSAEERLKDLQGALDHIQNTIKNKEVDE